MRVRIWILVTLLASALNAEFEYRVENSNFSISQGSVNPDSDKTYLYNYNRLRFRGDYTQDEFFATLIADGVNYYGSEYINSLDFEYVKLQNQTLHLKRRVDIKSMGMEVRTLRFIESMVVTKTIETELF